MIIGTKSATLSKVCDFLLTWVAMMLGRLAANMVKVVEVGVAMMLTPDSETGHGTGFRFP
jgi:hypothetical protein